MTDGFASRTKAKSTCKKKQVILVSYLQTVRFVTKKIQTPFQNRWPITVFLMDYRNKEKLNVSYN